MLYSRDADAFDALSHDIPYLAQRLKDSVLQDLADQLERRVGPHARMRYPDVLVYPRVPADVFSDDDASWACDKAGLVVDRVQSLIEVRGQCEAQRVCTSGRVYVPCIYPHARGPCCACVTSFER